jgi:ribose 5-phosphate isomerase A
MAAKLSPIDRAKDAAARRSVAFVESGMSIGLGTGSTAAWMVRALAARVKDEGLKVRCTTTSTRTRDLATQLGLVTEDLDTLGWLDLTIDGADEIDPGLNLVKGGGAALLQEKIVATASDRMIVIADAGKVVPVLGAFPLPVEVIPFGWRTTQGLIEEVLTGLDVEARDVAMRMSGEAPLVTDNGNHILDLRLGRIGQARNLAMALNQIPGVVENGLFLGMCDLAVIGRDDGRVDLLEPEGGSAALRGMAEAAGTDNLFRD